jgi:hypothetical protein
LFEFVLYDNDMTMLAGRTMMMTTIMRRNECAQRCCWQASSRLKSKLLDTLRYRNLTHIGHGSLRLFFEIVRGLLGKVLNP